jgi:hypothetical protein
VREFRLLGSVRGVRGNAHPYRSKDFLVTKRESDPRQPPVDELPLLYPWIKAKRRPKATKRLLVGKREGLEHAASPRQPEVSGVSIDSLVSLLSLWVGWCQHAAAQAPIRASSRRPLRQ